MPPTPFAPRLLILAVFALACTAIGPRAEVVSQWSFENDLLDSAAGGGTSDHLNAAAFDGPLNTVYVAGVVGQAVQVGEAAGDATVLSAPDSNDLDLASEFTVEAFVYRSLEHGQDWERFATKWFDGGNQWHWAFRGPPNRSQDLFLNGDQQINQGNVSADLPLNEWHHVAITGDPANGLRIWQDGVVVGTAAYLVPQDGSDSLRIGNRMIGASSLQFSGWVDEFQIHNVSQDAAYHASRTALITGGPVITSFTASPQAVAAGDSSTLSWNTANGDSLTLDGGTFVNSDVTGQQMAIALNLTTNTTFTLTATNAQGTTNAQLTVGVGVAGAALRINEFLAINDNGFKDEDGDDSDWIEIFNPGAAPALLDGWHLTDDPLDLTKWQFPATSMPTLGYLVVFASNKDRIAGPRLHTNFKLDGAGEYLALVEPDGVTIATEFAPAYPPQQSNVSYGYHGTPVLERALFPPTPQSPNTSPAGPIIRNLTENPVPVPFPGANLLITAEILPSPSPITSATLHYRAMFGAEVPVPMSDAGGGIFQGIIPSAALRPREMVRWRVTAQSQDGESSKAPLFLDPVNSPHYHGTVIAEPRITSDLPIMHRFVENPAGTETRSGTRGAFFYNGEFFDNIFTRIRGGTSANWPKKSYKIEFNDGHHFRFREGVPRVDEINLNTTYTDKSYVRTVLTYEHQRDAGMPSPESFLIHLRQNGAFWNVAILIEQPDRDYLRRWNLDPDGAFYKGATAPTHYEPVDPLSNWEKKTRLQEDKSDLDALIDGLAQTGPALETYLFDNVDLPIQVNYMATTCISQNIDGSDKNHFLYRDTNGSGEWAMFPWDLDLTFGPDALNTDNMVAREAGTSHPWIGARPHTLNLAPKYNHFLETIVATPRSRAMLNRRIRTLIDEHLASGYFHDRIDELVAQIAPDVLLDKAKWGGSTHFGGATYTLQAANDRIVNEYLDPRVPYLTITEGQAGNGTVLLPANSPITALVPTSNALGDTWKELVFDDSAWLSGTGGVGYERSPSMAYTSLLGIDLLSPLIPAGMRIDTNGDGTNENNSCYVRYEFNVADKAAISSLNLRLKYDDGFVAFLNGTQVAARNDPTLLVWDSQADDSHRDSDALVFENIDITAFKNSLNNGSNVLAIDALNFLSTSSDMLFACELVEGAGGSGNGAGIPPSQPVSPAVNFGTIEYNPASGNQDEEFIELINSNAYDLDISGWILEGGVTHVMKGGTVIPAGESLYLSPNSAAFRNRALSPKGGENRFVQGNYGGHLSNFGEGLTLKDSAGTVLAQTTTPVDPSDPQLYLVVSEIFYHPAGDPGEEFVELLNISDLITLDLTGVRFTAGIEFDLTGGAITSLAPRARLLVVRNQAAFEAVSGPGLPIAGEFANLTVLNNDGETLKLEDASNSTIKEFRYNDALPWPTAPDGLGPSLVLINPQFNPDPSLASNWRSSTLPNGNPAASDATTFTGTAGADSDSNGLDDLIDYALGHAPGAHDGIPVPTLENGILVLSYTRNLAADDFSVIPQWSTNLLDWQSVSESFALLSQTPIPGGRQTVVYASDPATFPLGNRIFIRLQFQQR
jgi:hypothetical protein